MGESRPGAAARQRDTRAAFDAGGDIWKIVLPKGVTRISFKPIRDHWGDRHADNARQAAWAYLENHAPDTVANAVGFLGRMSRHVPVGATLSAATLMNYRSRLSREHLHYLGHIAAFLKFWLARGYPGVDSTVLDFFRSVSIPGNIKGSAVRTHDPVTGPFTDPELQGIMLAAREAYRRGIVSQQDFAILLTLTATGARSGQVSMLVCGDLIPSARETSTVRLRVPSLKKRTRERLTRERIIPGELAVVLSELLEERRLDGRFAGVALERRPMFANPAKSFESLEHAHIGAAGVAFAVNRVRKALRLRSARTGVLMNFTPRRFRRTLGTRAAEAGHAPVLIADLLDHSDLQHVGVYVEARASIQDRMDAALGDRAEPLVGLFTGAVVANEAKSGVADAPSRRVAAAAGSRVGTCAGPRDCNRLAPLACYTCAAFRPWRDAPHEALLKSLIEERKALLADGVSLQVAGANDATIMAVEEVAGRCRAMRTGHAHG